MSTLVKYKNQTEYSFYIWMRNYPESTHWADRERFYKFVKTVCVFNALKWKNANYFKKRILSEKPNFDPENLRNIIILYECLIDFYKVSSMPRCWVIEEVKVKEDYYIERGVRNGIFLEVLKEIKK